MIPYQEVPKHCGEYVVLCTGFDRCGSISGLGFGNADNSMINGSDEYYMYSDARIHKEVDNNDDLISLEQGTMPSGEGWDIS